LARWSRSSDAIFLASTAAVVSAFRQLMLLLGVQWSHRFETLKPEVEDGGSPLKPSYPARSLHPLSVICSRAHRLPRIAGKESARTPMREVRHASENQPERRRDEMTRYEYKILDTDRNTEAELNLLGAQGWQVVGVTTKKQVLIAPPAAIILMREVRSVADLAA
jgi:hypothetical protein